MQQSPPDRRKENIKMAKCVKALENSVKVESHYNESHVQYKLPAAHETLCPSSNTAEVSFSLQHTFSAVPLLSWFAENKRRRNIQFVRGHVRQNICPAQMNKQDKILQLLYKKLRKCSGFLHI